jgi:hypothetical protein
MFPLVVGGSGRSHMAPINRSVYWIASSHVAHTCAWGLIPFLPFSCLMGILGEDAKLNPTVVLCLILQWTLPLLIGLRFSFSHLRRTTVIQHAASCTVASTAIFSGFGATLICLALFKSAGTALGERILLAGIFAADCGIFWLLTRNAFNGMQTATEAGFPVLIASRGQSFESTNDIE